MWKRAVKIADYHYQTRSSYATTAAFRIRLYLTEHYPVVLASAHRADDSSDDSDLVRYLAAEIAKNHREVLHDGEPFVWIVEHRRDGLARTRYERVVFDSYRAHRVYNHGIRRRWLGASRRGPINVRAIEAMIGERL